MLRFPGSRALSAADRERQAASLAALEAGGIPAQAAARLKDQRERAADAFTSDLTTNEHLLVRHAGYQPLGFVMGSAFHTVRVPTGTFNALTTHEISEISRSILAGRQLALGRLRQEAQLLGAHGVIGVEMREQEYEWAPYTYEFTAIGTAIRVPRAPEQEPFSCHLSGQKFWQLQAGYWPVGLHFGISCYWVVDRPTANDLDDGSAMSYYGNQEIVYYSRAVQTARRRAMADLAASVDGSGAAGIVGVLVRSEIQPQSGGGALRVDFQVSGTAVAHAARAPQAKSGRPLTMLDLNTGSATEIG